MHRKFWLKILKRKDHLEDLSADGKILKWILRKYGGRTIAQAVRYQISILHRLCTTSFFIEIHFYDDMFWIFIDPASGHISRRRLHYCNVITRRLSLKYYKKVKIVIKDD
jgi:hypothetical protein